MHTCSSWKMWRGLQVEETHLAAQASLRLQSLPIPWANWPLGSLLKKDRTSPDGQGEKRALCLCGSSLVEAPSHQRGPGKALLVTAGNRREGQAVGSPGLSSALPSRNNDLSLTRPSRPVLGHPAPLPVPQPGLQLSSHFFNHSQPGAHTLP